MLSAQRCVLLVDIGARHRLDPQGTAASGGRKETAFRGFDMCKDALKLMKGVRSAGAVFAGAWTPESAGDFVAGPSHVLPTGGAANMFNGLTPDDFRRRHSFVAFTKEDLAETKKTIEAFAEVEGLDAHGRAASIRFE